LGADTSACSDLPEDVVIDLLQDVAKTTKQTAYMIFIDALTFIFSLYKIKQHV
jgi:hypothetical protein